MTEHLGKGDKLTIGEHTYTVGEEVVLGGDLDHMSEAPFASQDLINEAVKILANKIDQQVMDLAMGAMLAPGAGIDLASGPEGSTLMLYGPAKASHSYVFGAWPAPTLAPEPPLVTKPKPVAVPVEELLVPMAATRAITLED